MRPLLVAGAASVEQARELVAAGADLVWPEGGGVSAEALISAGVPVCEEAPAASIAAGPAGLAALAAAADDGVERVRVEDVPAARDFLRVRAALRGELELAADATLPPELRHER